MSGIKIPDGYTLLSDRDGTLTVEHDATQMWVRVSSCALKVCGADGRQAELDYCIAKFERERAKDRLFEECDRDIAEFRRRIAAGELV